MEGTRRQQEKARNIKRRRNAGREWSMLVKEIGELQIHMQKKKQKAKQTKS